MASTAWLVKETLLDLAILQSLEHRREESRAGVESRKEAQTNKNPTNKPKRLQLKMGRRRKCERMSTNGVSSKQHSRKSCSALGEKSWQSTGSGHCRAEGADGS